MRFTYCPHCGKRLIQKEIGNKLCLCGRDHENWGIRRGNRDPGGKGIN